MKYTVNFIIGGCNMNIKKMIFCVLVLISSNAFAKTFLFSSNFDATLDAQVFPGSGVKTPTETDADNDSGLTTGGQGYGGGEALVIKDGADEINYKLGALNTHDWFPAKGRVSMKVKFNQLIPGTAVQLFAFTYSGNPNLELFAVEMGYLGHSVVPGGWIIIRGKDATVSPTLWTYDNSTNPDEPVEIPGMAGNVIGWHDVVVEWTEVTPYNQDEYIQEIINVSAYVDGQLALNVPDMPIGSPRYMDRLSFGSWINQEPLGYYSDSLIDEFTIEALPAFCGDINTEYSSADISGPLGAPDCKVDIFDFDAIAQEWLNCSDPANPECGQYYTGCDPTDIFTDEQVIAATPETTWDFDVPANVSSVYLSLEGRYWTGTGTKGTPVPAVRYYINGHRFDEPGKMVNVYDARDLICPNGQSLSWMGDGLFWLLPQSSDWNTFSNTAFPIEMQQDPYRIVLDITNSVMFGRTNTLWIDNINAGANLYFRNAQILCRYERPAANLAIRDVPNINGPVVPQTNFAVPYTRSIPNGGGIIVNVGGTNYNIESKYSYPNGTWNTLTTGSVSQGEWVVSVAGNSVTGTGQKYRLNRTVNNLGERIQVLDTLTNLTAQPISIRVSHAIKNLESSLDKTYLSGMRVPTKQGWAGCTVTSRDNPSVYVMDQTSGIGLLARDNVFRSHINLSLSSGNYAIGDDYFALDGNASYIMEWDIYPTNSGDYFAFVNAARRALNANYLIDGCMMIGSGQCGNTNVFTDAQILNMVNSNNIKYVILDSSVLVDSSGAIVSGESLNGSDFMKTRGDSNRYWLQQWINRYHNIAPGVKVLPYVNPWLCTEASATTTYADSYAKNPNGTPQLGGGGSWQIPVMCPTLTNSYGPALTATFNWLLTNSDGFFMDGSSMTWDDAGGPWDYRTEIWDNHTATNNASFVLLTKVTEKALSTLSYRVARFQSAISQGKKMWLNHGPSAEEVAAMQLYHFNETFLTNCPVFTHLYTPTSLSTNYMGTLESDIGYDIATKLRYGGLYLPRAFVYRTSGNILQDMYPIHPKELHCGYIIGQDKIITAISGQYGFGDSSALTVKIYDSAGFRLPEKTATANSLADVQLLEGEMAIITR